MTDKKQPTSRTERRRIREERKKKSTNKSKGFFKKLFLACLVFFTVCFIGGVLTIFAIVKDAPELNPEQLMFAQPAQMFDQNDEQFTQLHAAENRIMVTMADVPQVLEDAFLATEDVRFRQHFGLDVRRMFGALAANVRGGFGAEGASTITQQVIKNAFLTHEKKLTRKIQEQYLAIKLEQQYSKDQILEMYLNIIYLANGNYGVQQASIAYFGKEDLNELTIEDAALLAGMPQRPEHFNPLRNPEAAEKRRNIVISLMERHGKISPEEAEAARSVAIEDQLNPIERETEPYQAFIDQVFSEVEAMPGITTNDLYTAGLKIYTTIDTNAQSTVERVLQTDEFIQGFPDNEDFQAGVTLIDTKTGQIKAIGGGRHKTDVKRGFNYATDIKKQPGSTIKPILDYGPVIEYHKWSTGQIIVDEPHTYNDTARTPIRNHNRNYSGPVTMRKALADSLNIPAIKALQEVGTERAQDFAEGLGIPFEEGENITEAYGIGGFRTGISTLDLAGSYAAFGNDGIYNTPHTVRKIEFPDGRVVETSPDPYVAMSDYTAYMITDMLKSVVREGTGRNANVSGLALAGKTGTTNFAEDDRKKYNIPSGGVPDVWFAGYTTNYTAAVWTGYDRKGEGNYLINNDRRLAQLIFREIMSEVSKGIETPDFVQPNSVVKVGIERTTGKLPSPYTPASEIVYELFVKGTEPTQVSEQFQELTAPQGFSAIYDEATEQISLSWSYPDNEIAEVSFRLQQSVNGGDFETVDMMKATQIVLSNSERGSTYRFRVTAVSDNNADLESEPATTEISIPDFEEVPEIPDPLEEPLDEENPPRDANNGNGNRNRDRDREILDDLPIDIIPEPGDDAANESNNEEEAETQ